MRIYRLLYVVLLVFFVGSDLLSANEIEKYFKPALNKEGHHKMRNIDFIYMINLDERPRKFEDCLEQLSLYGVFPYRFSAVNGWLLPFSTIQSVGVIYEPWMYRAPVRGNYYIGDALVSRISVKSTLELKNIINKLIFYEKGNFINTEWISKAIVVGTHEFNGINHTSGIVNAMREQSGYFNKVIQILETDNNPHTTLMEAIENEGANMIVYNSHGSPDGFGSIVLNNSHISTLNTFGNSFPFIHGAGCSTGSFQWSEGDCFAEVILKTGTIEKPSGPVAMLAFSRSANPGPAMMAQRKAFKELFFIKEINTIGELCYFSNLYAMSQFDDYEAEKFYKHWHIFGDCSAPIWKSNE